MGVPAFFRWLGRKYPKIISNVIEEPGEFVDGVEIPADYRNDNPNGELDNLYLDMNGIVHPCTHPEGRPAPETEDEMMLEVFKYTDRVVRMARPRKILMIAVDGVAPRAKMNQQRSRRFRSGQDAKLAANAKEAAIDEAEARGQIIDEAIKGKKSWDSNAITPGTPFMDILAKSLRYWVAYKLNNDPGWQNLSVIISDATVPGEGEHKIMEFVRSQRCDPSHDPNTSHCMYGLDADLIFLGLATHEPHFRILREDVFAQDNKKRGPRNNNMNILDKHRADLEAQADKEADAKKSFIWLHVDLLRQYLEVELQVARLPFPFDFERAIDDWVFMCFFVGNDFLPHLPCLDVRDNSIDMLLNIWKNSLPKMGGYMTCDGQVNLARVEVMIQALGIQEDGIFRKRRNQEVRRLENEKRRRQDKDNQRRPGMRGGPGAPVALSKNRGERAPVNPLENMPLYTASGESVGSTHMSNSDLVANRNALSLANDANKSAAQDLKAKLISGSFGEGDNTDTQDTPAETPSEASESTFEELGSKRKADEQITKQQDDGFDEPDDNIRLWEPGYRDRYYTNKYHVSPNDNEFKREVVSKYIEGVCWVLLYYYQGCASWTWFYPYHYAPFAADFKDLSSIKVEFDKGQPFRPYEQLMSVMPATSSHTLPDVFHPLMSEPDSEIIDFYPVDFPIDMNGKKMSWQGIALLPFIDEKRLLDAVHKKYPLLTEAEVVRNTNKDEILIISTGNKLYQVIKKIYDSETTEHDIKFHADVGHGLAGEITKLDNFKAGDNLLFPLKTEETEAWPNITNNQAIVVTYHMPKLIGYHKSMLLSGVKLRDSVLSYEDVEATKNGGRRDNRYNSHGGGYNGGYSNPGDRVASKPQRAGGYKYFVEHGYGRENNRGGHTDGHGGAGNGSGHYNQGYQNQGYQNQGYQNQGYQNQGYQNQGYQNQGYQNQNYQNQNYQNQNYHNQGYQNQGYGQRNYNQGYGQGNYSQGYNNQGYNKYNNGGHGGYRGSQRSHQSVPDNSGEFRGPSRGSNYPSRGNNNNQTGGFSYK